ncbi:ATP-binding protein [Massilia antarctica]|uniref:ATP-binding protein n=1 Tax=Massilia antarctica TaxID=2765360 RepID=UPI0007C68443|nr:ATP-binding protein [Massilia sp. H27-R4]MCY0911437.1 ATP-binding protein [Massilia sp. H27-R4]
MRAWWRPSLVRRVLAALAMAFLLVWCMLLAYEYLQFRQEVEQHSGVQKIGAALYAALVKLDTPGQVKTAVATTAIWLNLVRHDANQLPDDLVFELWDREGRLVYSSSAAASRALASPAPAAGGGTGSTAYWTYQRGAPDWSLRIAEPKPERSATLGGLGRGLIPYLLISLPCVVLPLWLAVHQGLRPLRLLAERIAARQRDDLSPIGMDPKYSELRPLVAAFEELLARLRSKAQRERAFIQDAAHELRTPMAVISTQAHVIGRAADPAERQRAQDHLDLAIARASHLTRQLLELATLDEMEPGTFETVDAADVVRQLLAQQMPAVLARRMDLSLDAPDTLTWAVEVAAFQSIVTNLLDNSLRYVPPGGCVLVRLRSDDTGLILSFADDGPGIPEDQRAHIFERFRRGRGHETPGSGLGLAIVRQAAARAGGGVRIIAGLNGKGCGFEVRLRLGKLDAAHG